MISAAVIGTWDAEISTPIGKQNVVFEVSVDAAGTLCGSATDKYGVVPLLDLVVDGARIVWIQHVTRPLRLTLQFNVEVDGDHLTGTAKAGVLPASRVVAQRRLHAL